MNSFNRKPQAYALSWRRLSETPALTAHLGSRLGETRPQTPDPVLRIRVLGCILATAWLAGCEPSRPTPPSEPTIQQQLTAVRHGSQDTIRVEKGLVTDQDLAEFQDCLRLRELIIERSTITDLGVRQLTNLPALEHLRIRGAIIRDDGLKHLTQFQELRVLNLPQAQFSNDGLPSLTGLPKLELLRIGSPDVSDAGMEHIAQLRQLRFLHLIGIRITDAGLDKLQGLTQLESLYLDDTNVTDAGIERFSAALPKVHFHINQQHYDRDPQRHSH